MVIRDGEWEIETGEGGEEEDSSLDIKEMEDFGVYNLKRKTSSISHWPYTRSGHAILSLLRGHARFQRDCPLHLARC